MAGPPHSRRSHPRTDILPSAAVVVLALCLFAWLAGRYFPSSEGLVGADYSYFVPLLVAGDFWFQQNGFAHLPYFTPAFCGGSLLLANPQSVIFSVPQLLTAITGPVGAIFTTLLLFAALGGSGTYALLVRCFRLSQQAGVLGATLFLFNGFLMYRVAIGHLPYHAYGLVPLLTLVTLSTHRSVRRGDWRYSRHVVTPIVIGGLLVSYVTYSGALNLQVPFVLTVVCLLSFLQLRAGFDVVPWLVLIGSGLWGVLLSAVKLAPATLLAGRFVRSYIPLHLFHNPVAQLRLLLEGLFAPSLLPDHVWFPGGGHLGRHEFELGVSLVPLVLILLVVVRHARASGRLPRLSRTPYTALILSGVLLLPLMLTFGGWRWGTLLLEIPVINNNTTFVRWWLIYLLPIIVLGSASFDRLAPTPRRRAALLALCAGLAMAQQILLASPYYARADNTYDPGAVVAAYHSARDGAGPPRIESIASSVVPTGSEMTRSEHINDGFIHGRSSWPCYEPLFGYALEIAPSLGLREGLIQGAGPDDLLNIVDPSVYLSTAGDRPWRFPAARLGEARRFAAYQPYQWDIPVWQRAASYATLCGFAASFVYLAAVLGGAARGRAARASARVG